MFLHQTSRIRRGECHNSVPSGRGLPHGSERERVCLMSCTSRIVSHLKRQSAHLCAPVFESNSPRLCVQVDACSDIETRISTCDPQVSKQRKTQTNKAKLSLLPNLDQDCSGSPSQKLTKVSNKHSRVWWPLVR